MKLARRRTDVVVPEPDAPSIPQPPHGAPVAVFAGILDGQRLWVAVDARPGTLALRSASSGGPGSPGSPGSAVVPLANEVTDDQPAYLAARLDLGGLPGHDDATYDVVVAPPGGRPAVPVWTHPLPVRPVPPAADHRTQHTLHRSPDGHLQVRRTTLPAAATLATVTVVPGGIALGLDVPDAGGSPADLGLLALLADDDTVLATYPATPEGHLLTAVLTCGPLDDAPPQVARVVLGAPGAWLPVRRRANDLADPGRDALLPELDDDASQGLRLRLRWSGRASLQARLFAPGATGESS